ncbi:sulfate transporter CysZ [Ursidibacter maritimus]|uniref:Sulfate transporter CysZ n=1 Tax=Ursidibacter maritimus TaxID=1331689 RepID=A0A949T441_9PAST|nr:sulfate transporter CysZ [Ursidibacter maritimus]KAE9540292.1 sulfate transporter CysZ [Ursidibacter maritimus]MBV6524189.1 sulfate transporter CysZ [Ursidibacter maritimus]MBV6525673.1 sulfate transporter CysZ [Ursidibacter maritimus]MBV6528162.1 sulfate transporter CysZ [Ursidibacter maritimus]MBV6528982.1 sulfate transporter CysZ [Ursidibacter maritimus]
MSSSFTSPESQVGTGFHYFIYGWRLLLQRQLMPFVVLPVIINAILMIGLIWLFFANIGGLLDAMLPSWLEWLSFILIPLIFLMILVLFYFAFTTLANFIAAPFNALLAEKVEQQLTGENLTEMSMAELLKDVPRMLKREWQKMWYSIPRLLALFLLGFVPVLGQTIVPVLTFMFGAWLLAIQYCDYPFDNHKISFARMRNALGQRRIMNFTFGSLVSLFMMVPFLNLVAMPVAVCGASAMWVKEYRNFLLGKTSGEFDNADFLAKSQSNAVSTETRNGNITKP